MSSERRFSQKEIAAIFNRASRAQEKVSAEAAQEEGLTLADLHLIALETGISPDLITQAVLAVDEAPEEPKPETFLGLQLSISKTVNLDNPLTDADWDKLVVGFRNTFRAKGKVTREGSLREWSNGNLRIMAEPTAKGHRLHMQSLKGSTQGAIWTSLSFILAALFVFASSLFSGGLEGGIIVLSVVFAMAGLLSGGFSTLQLSQWRFDRMEHFESIAAQAQQLTSNRTAAEKRSEKQVAQAVQGDKSKLAQIQQSTDSPEADQPNDVRGPSGLLDGVDDEEAEDITPPSKTRDRDR
ncbi:MAG: hypothetical protein O3B41_09630 [Bacteroidetes bacterium]|nr:hypothetical protein [Bacteroidota bacterium]